MKAGRKILAVASSAVGGFLACAPTNAQIQLPWCDNSSGRDIGGGFRLTQYLFDGSSEFSLVFRVNARDVRTEALQMTAPFEFTFGSLDFEGRSTPRVGFQNYEFRNAGGGRLGFGLLTLDCGEGTTLTAHYGSSPPSDSVRAPVSFDSPFFVQRRAIPQCLREIAGANRIKFTVRQQEASAASVMIDSPVSLEQAIAEARRRWETAIARAQRGECRLIPSPPPPF